MSVINTVVSPIDTKERANLRFSSGDTVRVIQKVKEGDKTRLQVFEGLVIARRHGKEAGAMFTVRKVSDGIGVERIFPLYSPAIEKIEVVSRSQVRRAKLYYVREKAIKAIQKKLRRTRIEEGVSKVTVQQVEGSEQTEQAPVLERAPEKFEKPKKGFLKKILRK